MFLEMNKMIGKVQFLSVCILFCITLSSAQRKDYKLTKQQLNRMFYFSSSAPMTKAINEITPSVIPHIKIILEYIAFIEKQILTSLAKGKQLKPDQLSRLCTTSTPAFNGSLHRNFGLRGFPAPDTSCITDIQVESDSISKNAPHELDELYTAVNERGLILNRNMKAIASRFIDVENNFTGAELPHSFVYHTHRAHCLLHTACGIRVGEHWRVATPINNRDKYENLPNFRRQVINEYARPINGKLGDNLQLRLPVYRTDDLPRKIREDATTYIVSWSKSAHPNCFRRTEIWENPAIIEALDKSDHFLQQAEDALTPSSVAILVLPVGLNLVPVWLIAQVSTTRMLLYILFSDILTCVPLLIKGVELILIHRNPYRAFTVRVTSASDGTRSESAGAEVWAAECRAPSQTGHAGIAFVVLALVFMIIGVVCELLARKYMHKRILKARLVAHIDRDKDLSACSKHNGTEKSIDMLLSIAFSSEEDSSSKKSSSGVNVLSI